MTALAVARAVALGKATALVAAMVAGAAVALAVKVLPDAGRTSAAGHDLRVAAGGAVVTVLLAAGRAAAGAGRHRPDAPRMSPIRVQLAAPLPGQVDGRGGRAAGRGASPGGWPPTAAGRWWTPAGRRVDGWRYRRMLQVRAVPTETGLRLSAPGRAPIEVAFPDPAIRRPTAHTRLESAVPAGAAADRWLSEWLGTEVHLVWLDDPRLRPMSAAHGGSPDEPLSLADAGPVLLISQGSLTELDRWMAELAGELGEASPEAAGDDPVPSQRRHRRRTSRLPRTAGGDCASARSISASPSCVTGASSPRSTRSPGRWQGADADVGPAPPLGGQDLVRGSADPDIAGHRPGGR